MFLYPIIFSDRLWLQFRYHNNTIIIITPTLSHTRQNGVNIAASQREASDRQPEACIACARKNLQRVQANEQDAESAIKQSKIACRSSRLDVWSGCLDRGERCLCAIAPHSACSPRRMELACAHGNAGAIRQFRSYTVYPVHKVSLCFIMCLGTIA